MQMQPTETAARDIAQTIADRVGGRVIDDRHYGFKIALNNERGTYVARVTLRGEVRKQTNNGARVDLCDVSLDHFLATYSEPIA